MIRPWHIAHSRAHGPSVDFNSSMDSTHPTSYLLPPKCIEINALPRFRVSASPCFHLLPRTFNQGSLGKPGHILISTRDRQFEFMAFFSPACRNRSAHVSPCHPVRPTERTCSDRHEGPAKGQPTEGPLAVASLGASSRRHTAPDGCAWLPVTRLVD